MAALEIPAGLNAITPRWLTEALRSSDVLETGSVTRVRAEAIAGNQGFAGQVQRMHIAYSDARAAAPPSLIAKLHSRSFDPRASPRPRSADARATFLPTARPNAGFTHTGPLLR